MRRPILILLVAAALVTSASAIEAEKKITLVTSSTSEELTVQLALSPAEWAKGAANLVGSGAEAVVVKFPHPRYYSFSGDLRAPVDVLLLNGEGQVLSVFTGVQGAAERAYSDPVSAAVFVWSSKQLVERLSLRAGSLLLATGFSFSSTTATPLDGSRRAEVLARMEKSAARHNAHWDEVGAFYLEAGEFAAALKTYEKAYGLDNSPGSLLGVAMAHAGAGTMDKALATFGKLIEAHPSYMPAYRHLSRLLQYIKKPEMVVAMLLSGLEQNPDLLELRLELARLQVKMGKLDAARETLDAVKAPADEDKAKMARVRGDIFVRRGQMSAAAAQFALYLAGFPNAPHASELRIFIARHTPGTPPPVKGGK